jgi:hypothetical protein
MRRCVPRLHGTEGSARSTSPSRTSPTLSENWIASCRLLHYVVAVIRPPVCQCVCLALCPPARLPACLSVCLSVCLFAYLPACLNSLPVDPSCQFSALSVAASVGRSAQSIPSQSNITLYSSSTRRLNWWITGQLGLLFRPDANVI